LPSLIAGLKWTFTGRGTTAISVDLEPTKLVALYIKRYFYHAINSRKYHE